MGNPNKNPPLLGEFCSMAATTLTTLSYIKAFSLRTTAWGWNSVTGPLIWPKKDQFFWMSDVLMRGIFSEAPRLICTMLNFWSRSNSCWIQARQHQFQWLFHVWVSGCRWFADSAATVTGVLAWRGSPHCVRRTDNLLDGFFGDKWIGWLEPVPWPAKSLDITPMDFYLWGHTKEEAYKDEPWSPHELQEKITAFCRLLPESEVLKTTKDVVRRTQLCIGVILDSFRWGCSIPSKNSIRAGVVHLDVYCSLIYLHFAHLLLLLFSLPCGQSKLFCL